jgi:hypothetical protein
LYGIEREREMQNRNVVERERAPGKPNKLYGIEKRKGNAEEK